MTLKWTEKLFIYHQLNSKIKYVVHSHYDEDCRPSQYDIDNCNAVGIPYLIVSYPQKETYILEPTMKRKIILQGRMGELFGREHHLVCKNVHEAIHALDCMKGDVRRYLMDCTDNKIDFLVKKGKK